MKPAKQYDTATAFRTALEARLNNYATQNHMDVQHLRREVAFDRLLSRLFHIDLILLIDTEELNSQATLDAIKRTFERRKTHDLPAITPDSPADWKERFENMAKDCELHLDLEQAVEQLRSFMKPLGVHRQRG